MLSISHMKLAAVWERCSRQCRGRLATFLQQPIRKLFGASGSGEGEQLGAMNPITAPVSLFASARRKLRIKSVAHLQQPARITYCAC